MPKLEPTPVSPSLLLLDPNNPRLHTHQDDHVDEAEYHKFEVQRDTIEKMRDKKFNIDELVRGIEVNGFIPVDHIFVRKYLDTEYFLVLEGNRRVTAIKTILQKIRKARENGKDINETLRNSCLKLPFNR